MDVSVSLNDKKIEIGYNFICKTDFYSTFYKIQDTLLSHKSSKIKGFRHLFLSHLSVSLGPLRSDCQLLHPGLHSKSYPVYEVSA